MRWLRGAGWDGVGTQDMCNTAAAEGRLDVVEFLHQHGVAWPPGFCEFANTAGNLHVLKYAYDHGCAWDAWDALAPGVDAWLKRNGCGPWGGWKTHTFARAARAGELEVVKFLHKRGCAKDCSVFGAAAAGGHAQVLAYLMHNEFPIDEHDIASRIAEDRVKNSLLVLPGVHHHQRQYGEHDDGGRDNAL